MALCILLLAASATLAARSVEAAERRCDRRTLAEPDVRSVEAAARAASGGKLADLKVHQACIFDGRTSVTLIHQNTGLADGHREWWGVDCERERSTWYRRGGWKCEAPGLWRGMDIDFTFNGKPRTAHIAFAGNVSFETASGLVRRTFQLYDQPASPSPYCKADFLLTDTRSPLRIAWSELRSRHREQADEPEFEAFVELTGNVYHIQPFGFYGFAFEFTREAAADPANAPGCWGEWLVLD